MIRLTHFGYTDKNMVTIKEIALKAGVSPTTVSNVLNGNLKYVSKDVMARVQSVIAETQYVSNRGAIMLAHGVSHTIGVILNSVPRDTETVFEDPFEGTLLGSLNNEICSRGYYMMLQTTETPQEVIQMAETWKLDGLIILGIQGSHCSTIRKNSKKPIVFIDCYFDDDGQIYNNVGLEDEDGSYRLTNYLIENGHRKLAFLADSTILEGVDKMRYKGFCRALDDAGIPETENQFLGFSRKKGDRVNVLEQICSNPGRYTVLCYASDYYATEAMTYLKAKGISIPDDISVTGFDDNMLSRIVTPLLTTAHQDIIRKGKEAVQLLFSLMKDNLKNSTSVRLPVNLVIRDSVKKIP